MFSPYKNFTLCQSLAPRDEEKKYKILFSYKNYPEDMDQIIFCNFL